MIKSYAELMDAGEDFGVRSSLIDLLAWDAYEASCCLDPDEIPVDGWPPSTEQLTELLGGRKPTREEKDFWSYLVEQFVGLEEKPDFIFVYTWENLQEEEYCCCCGELMPIGTRVLKEEDDDEGCTGLYCRQCVSGGFRYTPKV